MKDLFKWKKHSWIFTTLCLGLGLLFVLAAHASIRIKYDEKLFKVGKEDILTLRAPDGKPLYSIKVFEGSLKEDTFISMQATYDTEANTIDFEFGPHGTEFRRPIRLRLSKQMLVNRGFDPEEIALYYYDEEVGKWVEETHGIDKEDAVILELEHFSKDYFARR